MTRANCTKDNKQIDQYCKWLSDYIKFSQKVFYKQPKFQII